MLYYILFVVIAIAFFARITKNNKNKSLYWFAVVILIVYSALRDGFIYPDIKNYYDYYKYGYAVLDMQEQFNIGYVLLNNVCKSLFPSFQFLLAIISVIVISLYVTAIKDYSPYIWLSLILFVIINYYPSFFLLRQYLAMGVFLFSLKYVIERKPIHYAICMLITVSFHTTAIVVIPLYFLYGMKYSKRNMFFILLGSIAVIYFFYSISTLINYFSGYYAHYFEVEAEESAWKRAIMKIYIFIVYLIVMRKNYYNTGMNRVIFYSMVFNVVICIAAVNVMGVYRIREYFSLADFIGIPIMVNELKSRNNFFKIIGYAMITVYIVLLLMSFNNFIYSENMNDSYRFFWENTQVVKG